MKKWMPAIFVIYSAIVLAKIYGTHVDLLNPPFTFPATFFPAATLPFQWTKELPTDLGEAKFMYRQQLERTGYDANVHIPPKLTVHTLLEHLNVGVHEASKASPAVDDSGIYIGSDTGMFYAVDFSGHVRWRYMNTDANFGVHSTAALDEKNVYFGNYHGDLIALDKATGTPRWINQLGFTIGSSVALLGNYLYAAVETVSPRNGFIACVDRRNGQLIWKSAYLGNQAHSSPSISVPLKKIFVGANNGKIFAFNLETGATEWTVQTGDSIKSTPTVIGDHVLVTSWDAHLYNLNAHTGSSEWKLDLGNLSQSSPTLAKNSNMVVVTSKSGVFFAVDLTTGKIRWKKELGGGRLQLPSALVVPDSHGEDEIAWTACFKKDLCALGLKSGKILQQIPLKGLVTGQPTAFKNKLYVAMDRGDLAELSAGDASAAPPAPAKK